MDKKRISLPIIVEGRYDKNTLLQIFDATVITTDGFAIFNSKEKRELIKKLAERGGVILLADSDAGGKQIRSYLSGLLPADKLFHAYVPEIKGKEPRKSAPSRAGLLGVEGMQREVLERALAPFVSDADVRANSTPKRVLTRLDLYTDGLSGGDNAAALRDGVARELCLPSRMSAKALLEAINLLYSYEEYREALGRVLQAVWKKEEN